MEDIWLSIKRPHLEVIVIEDREVGQVNDTENIFNNNNRREFKKY
jgi:hypothetical protein